jgi:hypothetical protein
VPFTLAQGAQVRADPGYLSRVNSAIVRQAAAVAVEPIGAMSADEYNARKTFAAQVMRSPSVWVQPWLHYLSADPGLSLTWYAPTLIASSTNANPTVVTTTTVHGLVAGDVVEIQGHPGNTNANGVWVVTTVPSTTTFQIPIGANAAGTAGGTAMEMVSDVDLNFTVQNGWSRMSEHWVRLP